MGWDLPDLPPMVCDCCSYRVVPEWQEEHGYEYAPRLEDWGFTRIADDFLYPSVSITRCEVWCDECCSHWKKMTWSEEDRKSKIETVGEMMSTLALFKEKRREVAAVRMADELNELAAKLLKFKNPSVVR